MVLMLPGRREVSPGAVCRGPPAAGWGWRAGWCGLASGVCAVGTRLSVG